MATYVPGVETYLPDIKPFTPDYKFLSAVLDVRTDKYNTNWKATNDLYNKVVYADLSRTDTKDQRDQYINQISPSLEKISGMDLSLMQNIDSAKAVFAPFFEDDLIVSDIMHTTNYRREMDLADRLQYSANQEQRTRYNQDGVRALQYQMEDFISATPDKAIKLGSPKFVEGVDLMGMAEKMLGELKPPLKVKRDTIQGDWIITQQNGTLVIPAAKAYLEKTLLSDPRVVNFYRNQSFVRSRDRAAEGIAKGEFTTVEQGQGAWAQETIDRITAQNAYYLEKDKTKLAEGEVVNNKWKNYQETNGVVPGSDDEKAMNTELSTYEKTKAALEARENVQKIANEPVKDFQTTLNKAYNLYTQTTIGRDILQAAAVYGSRDSEITVRENKVAMQQKQFQYDMSKIEAQAQNARQLEGLKGKIAYDLAKAKGEILYDADGKPLNPVLAVADEVTTAVGDIANSEFSVGPDGKPDPNTNMYTKFIDDFSKDRTEIRSKQLDVATSALTFLNPAGEGGTQKYTIKVGGENFTGSIEQIKTKLGERESNNTFKYRDDITNLYNQQSKIFNDPKEMAKYPGKAKSQTYANLFQQMYGDQGINAEWKRAEQTFAGVNKIYKEAHDQSVSALKTSDSNFKELMDQGMPGIYTTTGVQKEMTRDGYINYVKGLVLQGKVKGIRTEQMRKKEYMNYVDKKVIVNGKPRETTELVYSDQPLKGARISTLTYSVMFTDKTGKIVRAQDRNQLDQKSLMGATQVSDYDIENKAGDFYDKIKTSTNSALTMHQGDKFKTTTYKAYQNGKVGGADIFTAPVYRATIDPLSQTLEGQTMLSQMMTQKNMLDQKGIGYNMVLGNLRDKTNKESIGDDPLARKAYSAYIADMKTWLGNPKRSNSADIAPRGSIEYSSLFGAPGDGAKNTAGYTINGFNEWLASKIKGSATEASGPAGEYGLFSKPEVEKLKNGISMVFDKAQDISPRSENRQYYSKTLSALQNSPDQFVEYTYPGIDGMTPTATYRIVKSGSDEYYATYKINTYQSDGTYRTSDWEQIPLGVGTLNIGQEIDAQMLDFENSLESHRQMNLQDYNKNSATKGKKK